MCIRDSPMSVLYFEVPAKRTRKSAEDKAEAKTEKAASKKTAKTAKAEKAEEKTPAKRTRKPKAAPAAEEKAPAKRGRKPKTEACLLYTSVFGKMPNPPNSK